MQGRKAKPKQSWITFDTVVSCSFKFMLLSGNILDVFFFSRIDWMMEYQGMVVLAGNQVWWTWEVEDVFRKVKKGDKMGMKNYAKKMHKQISDLVEKVF